MDKPLWGLRVLKFDGAIAPRVLKFDSGSAAEGCGRARSRGAAGIGDRDRGSGSPAGQQSSGVGQPTIGRPFYVQAKGQLWPTRAFYAECAQVRAGRKARNADFILIAP